MAQEKIYKTLYSHDGHTPPGDCANNPSSSSNSRTNFEAELMKMLQTNIRTSGEMDPSLEISDKASSVSSMGSKDINLSYTNKDVKYNSAAATNRTETSTSNATNHDHNNTDNNCWWFCGPPPLDNPFNIEIKIVSSTSIYPSRYISENSAENELQLEPHFLYPFKKKQTSENWIASGMHNHNL